MSRNSRNTARERENREPKGYEQQQPMPYPSNPNDARQRNVARVSSDRSVDRNRARENDLYERQSM